MHHLANMFDAQNTDKEGFTLLVAVISISVLIFDGFLSVIGGKASMMFSRLPALVSAVQSRCLWLLQPVQAVKKIAQQVKNNPQELRISS